MSGVSATLQESSIVEGLRLGRVGRQVEVHGTVDSTNRLAWRRLAEGGADGLVVLAEHQSAGRGRFGRRWECPRGAGVLMSLALQEPLTRRGREAARSQGDRRASPAAACQGLNGNTLALLSAAAAVDAIERATGVSAEIKWPNDLVVRGRKLGGILIESQPSSGWFVMGIGINCLQHRRHFPAEWQSSATSLELETDQPVDRTPVVRQLLVELDRWLTDPGRWQADVLRAEWLRRALPLGGLIHLRQAGEEFVGQVLDVDPSAGLVVQLVGGGRRWFDAANTSVVAYA